MDGRIDHTQSHTPAEHQLPQLPQLPLSPYRALDLTDGNGYFCGKLFADLGMDVLKIEAPGGDSGRDIGPFYHDQQDREKSLYFWAYNTNKRGITLDLEIAAGQELFRKLVRDADFVIESFAPGYLDKLGLGYEALKALNPRVILVSVTPYGQTGPRRDWQSSDLVAIAMGGLSHITGSMSHPPVRTSVDQAHLIAGINAAMGAMIAHYYREATGQGQHVDVSIQQSVVIQSMSVPQAWDLNKYIWPRAGGFLPRSGKKVRYIWRCLDGYVSWRVFGGGLGAKTRAMVEWMDSLGQAGELIVVDWEQMDIVSVSPELFDRWQTLFAAFLKTQPKAQICQQALARGIVLSAVSTPDELLEDSQLCAHDFWQDVEHSELGETIKYPGDLYRSTAFSPRYRRAPLIGEHNRQVYQLELGVTEQEFAALKRAGVI